MGGRAMIEAFFAGNPRNRGGYMRMTDWKIGRIALIFGCALAGPAWAVTNVTFSVPGAVGTNAEAINNNGDVAGFYSDAYPSWSVFLRTSDGTFTTFTVPGVSSFSLPLSINDQDVITGSFLGTNGNYSAFMISNGVVSTIAPPDAVNTNTAVINDSGTIAGSYDTANGTRFGYIFSSDGAYASFAVPGGVYQVTAINANGDIAGLTYSPWRVFVRYSNGTLSTKNVDVNANAVPRGLNVSDQVVDTMEVVNYYLIDANPFIWTAPDGTVTRLPLDPGKFPIAQGINDSGEVVGIIENGAAFEGFLRSSGGQITIFNVGSVTTYANGINNSGIICGSTITSDSNPNSVGFLQFP
jgi:hypothetical protein